MDTLSKHTLNMTLGYVWLPEDFCHNLIHSCVMFLKKLLRIIQTSNSQHVVNIKPCSMCQAHKSMSSLWKSMTSLHASQRHTAGITNRFVCLYFILAAWCSWKLFCCSGCVWRLDCCSLPAALSDQIKSASASLSLSPLTSNKYLGCMSLLSSHTVK